MSSPHAGNGPGEPEGRTVVVDLGTRRLTVGDETFALPDSADPACHLARYVRAVNRLRSRPLRGTARLRHRDTEALASAFRLDTDEVTALLADLIGEERAHRRKLLSVRSGAGTLATVVVIGAAAAAVQSRASEAEAAQVLTAEELPPPGFEDETSVDAPGGPVTIEREDETSIDGDGFHPIEATPEDFPD